MHTSALSCWTVLWVRPRLVRRSCTAAAASRNWSERLDISRSRYVSTMSFEDGGGGGDRGGLDGGDDTLDEEEDAEKLLLMMMLVRFWLGSAPNQQRGDGLAC